MPSPVHPDAGTRPLAGRVALVTGANHGIGAAAANALARLGADVGVSYLRLAGADASPGYRRPRSETADATVAAVEAAGARALGVEADLSDPSAPGRVFDEVEDRLGAVSILVNNASGWRQDTFGAGATDELGRPISEVSADTFDAQFHVDGPGRGAADRRARPAPPGPGRPLGADRQPHSGGTTASPPRRRTGPPRPPSRTHPNHPAAAPSCLGGKPPSCHTCR